MKVTRLKYKDVSGAGKQIHGFMLDEYNCAEFTTKKNMYQRIASEPWIQFEPKEHSDMIETIFKQMVDCWNEKYAVSKEELKNI